MKKFKEALTLFIKFSAKHPNFINEYYEKIMKEHKLSFLDIEKLQVCNLIAHSHFPFTDYHVFQKIVKVINHTNANFIVHQEITPPEIEYAMYVIRKIDPHSVFSGEILAYIACIFHDNGILSLSPLIKKEVDNEGIQSQFFLNKLNKNGLNNELPPEAINIQNSYQEAIKKYSEYHIKKIESELKEINS